METAYKYYLELEFEFKKDVNLELFEKALGIKATGKTSLAESKGSRKTAKIWWKTKEFSDWNTDEILEKYIEKIAPKLENAHKFCEEFEASAGVCLVFTHLKDRPVIALTKHAIELLAKCGRKNYQLTIYKNLIKSQILFCDFLLRLRARCAIFYFKEKIMLVDLFEDYLNSKNLSEEKISAYIKCVNLISKVEKKFLEVIMVDAESYKQKALGGAYQSVSEFAGAEIVESLKNLDEFLSAYLEKNNLLGTRPHLKTWLDNKFKYEVLSDITPLKNKEIVCFYYADPSALGDCSVLNLMDKNGTLYRFEYAYSPLQKEIIDFCENAYSGNWGQIDLGDGHRFFVKSELYEHVKKAFDAFSDLSIFFIWHGAQMVKFILGIK